jgi:hypothetical protein
MRVEWSILALLRCHHVDTTRHTGHLLAPTIRAFWLRYLVLGDSLGTLERLTAFLATVLIGWHGAPPSWTCGNRDTNLAAARLAKRSPTQFAWATRCDADDRLHDERVVPLRVVHCDRRADRQLQHGSVLTFAQMCQQDDLSVWKLKGVMMNV